MPKEGTTGWRMKCPLRSMVKKANTIPRNPAETVVPCGSRFRFSCSHRPHVNVQEEPFWWWTHEKLVGNGCESKHVKHPWQPNHGRLTFPHMRNPNDRVAMAHACPVSQLEHGLRSLVCFQQRLTWLTL